MNNEPTYIEGLRVLWNGLLIIIKLLPKTFIRQTKKLLINHPIWLFVFISIMAYQFCLIAKERTYRDAMSKEMMELQNKLDSVNQTPTRYLGLTRKELSRLEK